MRKALLFTFVVALFCFPIVYGEPNSTSEITFEQIRDLAIENEEALWEIGELIDINYQLIQAIRTGFGFTNVQMQNNMEALHNVTEALEQHIYIDHTLADDLSPEVKVLQKEVAGLRAFIGPLAGAVFVSIALALLTLHRINVLMKK